MGIETSFCLNNQQIAPHFATATNYKDAMMMKLAGKGNGNYAYIDTLREARKTLVEQAGGTLNAIAKDVKIQVEFNPQHVQAYRLIGYEKRMLNKEDFNDDAKDAGEVGEGHTITALYEVVPNGVAFPPTKVDALKYQNPSSLKGTAKDAAKKEVTATLPKEIADEMLTVKIRYKKPDGQTSEKFDVPVKNLDKTFENASADFQFATAVASFGMILKESAFRGNLTLEKVQEIAEKSLSTKKDDYRVEFVEILKKAKSIPH